VKPNLLALAPPKAPTQNQLARQHGIPCWLKRYQKRYGKGDVEGIVASHKQHTVPLLDHGRDRAANPKRCGNET